MRERANLFLAGTGENFAIPHTRVRSLSLDCMHMPNVSRSSLDRREKGLEEPISTTATALMKLARGKSSDTEEKEEGGKEGRTL